MEWLLYHLYVQKTQSNSWTLEILLRKTRIKGVDILTQHNLKGWANFAYPLRSGQVSLELNHRSEQLSQDPSVDWWMRQVGVARAVQLSVPETPALAIVDSFRIMTITGDCYTGKLFAPGLWVHPTSTSRHWGNVLKSHDPSGQVRHEQSHSTPAPGLINVRLPVCQLQSSESNMQESTQVM